MEPPPDVEHGRHRGPAPEPHALEVDLHDPLPGRRGGVEHAAVVVGEDAGVVEQHVESAVGRRRRQPPWRRPGPRRPHRRSPPRPCRRPTSMSATAACGLVGDHVGHHHLGPFGGEQRRRHPSDAAAGPGDHGDLAVESCHRSPTRWRHCPVRADAHLIGAPAPGWDTDRHADRRARDPSIGVTTYRQTTSWWAWERDAALVPGTYSTWWRPPAAARCCCRPRGRSRRTGPRRWSGRCGRGARPGGGRPRRPGPDRRRATSTPPATASAADPRNGGINRGATTWSSVCWTRPWRRDLPVLAVCRGMQVLNVAPGRRPGPAAVPTSVGPTRSPARPGRLRPDRGGHRPRGASVAPAARGAGRRAVLPPPGRLDRLGRDLVVTARSADGVVEAVELPGHRFVVGVQWHPEEAGDLRLFEAAGREPAARLSPGRCSA